MGPCPCRCGGDREARRPGASTTPSARTPKARATASRRRRRGRRAWTSRWRSVSPRPATLIGRRLGFARSGFVPFYQAILDPGVIAGRRYGKLAGSRGAVDRGDTARAKAASLPADTEVRELLRTLVRTTTRCGRLARTWLRGLRATRRRLRALARPRDAAQALRDRGIVRRRGVLRGFA